MREFIRAWQVFDNEDIEKSLIVVGELSSECFACHKVGIERKANRCPECGAYFKYMGFRRKVRTGYLKEVKEQMPRIIFIDFEDFKKSVGKRDARKLLDI